MDQDKNLIIPNIQSISHEEFWEKFGRQGGFYDNTIDDDKVAEIIRKLYRTLRVSEWLLCDFLIAYTYIFIVFIIFFIYFPLIINHFFIFGLPPLRPFSRLAFCLAFDFDCPPLWPIADI